MTTNAPDAPDFDAAPEPAIGDAPRFGYSFMWVPDVAATVDFYERVFALRRRLLVENGPDGWYAELDTGSTTLGIADQREAENMMGATGIRALDPDQPPVAAGVSFIVPDVPAVYSRAVRAGATSQQEPKDMPWGQTVARVRDLNGLLVTIVTAPPSFG